MEHIGIIILCIMWVLILLAYIWYLVQRRVRYYKWTSPKGFTVLIKVWRSPFPYYENDEIKRKAFYLIEESNGIRAPGRYRPFNEDSEYFPLIVKVIKYAFGGDCFESNKQT